MQKNTEVTPQALTDVQSKLVAGLPQALTPQQPTAELLVAWEAMHHTETLPWAHEIATKLRNNERDEKLRPNDDRFHQMTQGLTGRLELELSKGEARKSQSNGLQFLTSTPNTDFAVNMRRSGHTRKVTSSIIRRKPGARFSSSRLCSASSKSRLNAQHTVTKKLSCRMACIRLNRVTICKQRR